MYRIEWFFIDLWYSLMDAVGITRLRMERYKRKHPEEFVHFDVEKDADPWNG